ncbi:Helix-turn-helix, partial [Dysosmobacter welbionis]
MLRPYQLHASASRISISSPGRTTPSRTTTAKIPSVGITHLPTACLMAQSLWHSLPIWVTSTSVSPIRRWVPTGRCFRSMPSVLMFSANTPGSSGMGQLARMVSTLSSASREICRCQSPAWASPTMPWRNFSWISGTGCFCSPFRSLMLTDTTFAN